MLTRFVPALVPAVVLAAMLAGAETAAVGPQEQKPAAAAAEKQAKPPKPWPPDEETLRKRKAEAEALPLFASQEPFEITLTADWKAVQRDRNVESRKTYPGTLTIAKDGAAATPVPIQLRTRGHSRRSPRTCEFAPLRLELPKDGTKGTLFEGHGNLKLGVHCQSEGIYLQYMLKEYLANRLHNLLTPRSLRVRLARVTYADSQPGRKPDTRLGLFFEDIDDLAKRMQARELSVPRQMFRYVDQDQLMFMSMFQYMIANTDYSILALHNVIMLDDARGVRLTVPYDFDYSGLVNTHYAIPFKDLKLSSVRERRWRGPCKTEADVEQALTPFLEKKAELLALPATLAAVGLEAGHVRSTEKYLNEFFEIIENPGKRNKAFVTGCTTGDGM
ncbi:MAG TPA: hypothetical protein VLN08_08950 [Vicinamibacterales bacterium]|nr:hypothetical protein [Vicinamibacterales bacterium]